MSKSTGKTEIDTPSSRILDPRVELEQQKAIIKLNGGYSPLASAIQLAESMRSTRYANEAAAMCDPIDNSIEAGASRIGIAIEGRGAKTDQVAILDNGIGMLPEMVGMCMGWGVTTRSGRNGLGRFGFGLSNASIKYATRFSVYSRVDSGQFHAATFDLDELRNHDYDRDGVVMTPQSSPAELPGWIKDYAEKTFRDGVSEVRTVIVWEKFDRLTTGAKSVAGLQEQVLRTLGTTYRSFMGEIEFDVNGRPCEPIDPLFTTPGARFYEVDGTMAESQPTLEWVVSDSSGQEHLVTARMSYIGFDAWNATVKNDANGKSSRPRFNVKKALQGIVVNRNGRQIEVIRPSFIAWDNYSRQVGVELNFPAELDELFGVTPDKQTIVMTDTVENIISKDLSRAINALKTRVGVENAQHKNEKERSGTGRPSEKALAKVEALKPSKSKRKPNPVLEEEAEKSLNRFIKEKAAAAGVPEAVIEPELRTWTNNHPVSIEFAPNPGGTFYEPFSRGIQTVVRLNTAHEFFLEIYNRLEPQQTEIRAGIELLLATIARAELDSADRPEVHSMYLNERLRWSDDLRLALRALPGVIHEGVEPSMFSHIDADEGDNN
jgi:hypothetical protein